ncbi:DUF6891 domain-containing protein [Hyalangium versicolor]|uniref:DUF6891 domain-containing protein n=1 Tax=Hyalangium versicolor TaxID=2861190 RepID=UPI001CCD5D71|nr:NusA N-terminal domain-containing protein [Hyalangium versicolor]
MATDAALLESLRDRVEALVLAGYGEEGWVLASVEELLRDELREDREAVEQLLVYSRGRFEELRAEEARWTEPTMNDRIDRAFEELNRQGIIALQNAGGSLSDGWREVEAAEQERFELVRGATFFHGQDVERGVQGAGLMLAFDAFEDDPRLRDEARVAIAREIRETLARHGVPTEWNGRVKTRIQILPFEWCKRREVSRPKDGSTLEQRALRRVVQEKGVSWEVAVAALERFILEAARKEYGAGRQLMAQYDPERGFVTVHQALQVVEQLSEDPSESENQRTQAQLGLLGTDVEPGDELLFQLFYRPDDVYEARAQDMQYGEILRLTTSGRKLLPWTARDLRDGILGHLPPEGD